MMGWGHPSAAATAILGFDGKIIRMAGLWWAKAQQKYALQYYTAQTIYYCIYYCTKSPTAKLVAGHQSANPFPFHFRHCKSKSRPRAGQSISSYATTAAATTIIAGAHSQIYAYFILKWEAVCSSFSPPTLALINKMRNYCTLIYFTYFFSEEQRSGFPAKSDSKEVQHTEALEQRYLALWLSSLESLEIIDHFKARLEKVGSTNRYQNC